MIYIITEERSAGCSCSPIDYNEINTILEGPEVDLVALRSEYFEDYAKLTRREQKKAGEFTDWLVSQKGFKVVKAIRFDRYLQGDVEVYNSNIKKDR